MNSSISQTHGKAISTEDRTKLSTFERILLLLPIAGGLVFGVFPLLFGGAFGAVLGAPGNDSYVYRLAGAATLGYAVALILGAGNFKITIAGFTLDGIGTATFGAIILYHLLRDDSRAEVSTADGATSARPHLAQ